MNLKPMLLCVVLTLSSAAGATVIKFGFGSLEGQPFAAGLGSFTISDVYSPEGKYEITGIDAEFGYEISGNRVFTPATILLGGTIDSNLLVGSDVSALKGFDLTYDIDGFRSSLDIDPANGSAVFRAPNGLVEVDLVLAGTLPQPAPPAPVPEPASWAMLVTGFGLVGGALRQRRRIAIRFA